MYDGIEFRGSAQRDVEVLAAYAGVPVYDGLTDEWHPTQMLADFLTRPGRRRRRLHRRVDVDGRAQGTEYRRGREIIEHTGMQDGLEVTGEVFDYPKRGRMAARARAVPVRASQAATITPNRNPPTWAENATPPPFALAENRP
jgi:Aspartate/ornithine carbamoyltransferase, carbamoyl-P binding domain